jgi:hypothetical protein
VAALDRAAALVWPQASKVREVPAPLRESAARVPAAQDAEPSDWGRCGRDCHPAIASGSAGHSLAAVLAQRLQAQVMNDQQRDENGARDDAAPGDRACRMRRVCPVTGVPAAPRPPLTCRNAVRNLWPVSWPERRLGWLATVG